VREKATEDPDLREMLVTIFNDADSGKTSPAQENLFFL
jgi:hypothetical protein